MEAATPVAASAFLHAFISEKYCVEFGNSWRASEFHIQTDETGSAKGGDTGDVRQFQFTLSVLRAAFVTAAVQRVDNQMTFLAYLLTWPLCLTNNTAGPKSEAKEVESKPMNKANSPSAVVSETNSPEANLSSAEEGVQRHWRGVSTRRSFLKRPGTARGRASAAGVL